MLVDREANRWLTNFLTRKFVTRVLIKSWSCLQSTHTHTHTHGGLSWQNSGTRENWTLLAGLRDIDIACRPRIDRPIWTCVHACTNADRKTHIGQTQTRIGRRDGWMKSVTVPHLRIPSLKISRGNTIARSNNIFLLSLFFLRISASAVLASLLNQYHILPVSRIIFKVSLGKKIYYFY